MPNPLFEMWLKEWKQEAADKGIKSQYVYAKVLHNDPIKKKTDLYKFC